MAPDHGEDDFTLCKAHGIDPVFAVEPGGFYRADWAWMGGQGSVIAPKLNAPEGPICSDLREAGALLSAAPFKHSYPHSWRSKAKVIYRCTPRSEEHTSELQSLMRISYAVFCLKKKRKTNHQVHTHIQTTTRRLQI